MKRILVFIVLTAIFGLWVAPVWPGNPFTSRPVSRQKTPEPPVESELFVKLIIWQHQLKQKMSDLIRVTQSRSDLKPLIVLMGLAFVYGAVHAAGPGHGKVLALSFVMSHRATIRGGLLLAVGIAGVHAFSGVAGVLGLRWLIQQSVSGTLASVTTVTQIVSFGLITLLGAGILLKNGCDLFFPNKEKTEQNSRTPSAKTVLPWAASIGLVPCPAVVMVMLFCLSMQALVLGLVLAACISAGMATTISGVVMLAVAGKSGVLNAVPETRAECIEKIVSLISGGVITVVGGLLLLATLHSTFL